MEENAMNEAILWKAFCMDVDRKNKQEKKDLSDEKKQRGQILTVSQFLER